jgi:hypothetical protein
MANAVDAVVAPEQTKATFGHSSVIPIGWDKAKAG